MSTVQPMSLTPIRTVPESPEFQSLLTWPFPEHPFHIGQVKRVLQNDIPQRSAYGWCLIWLYRDDNGDIVGFGTLDLCEDYARFTGDKPHPYIPVLAVHPNFQNRGHGRRIVEHLVAHAAVSVRKMPHVSTLLFLDVYKSNPAISLYEKCGFEVLNPDSPIPDPSENNEPYFIMAKNVAIATS
ncbi:MAG TPA: GNAT family N-acetyltransferase [Gemmataceae bacterium]|nr:GNAT family N-acetyltransferase [Gemmataceae bacterium]